MSSYVSRTPRGRLSHALLIVALFLVTALTAFPAPWNTTMRAMKDKVGFALPQLPDSGFTLGLDLKGGVHLEYEADMNSIPAADRADALEGVRDVIERRANALGVAESRVESVVDGDTYRVIVELPGLQDATAAMQLIGETPVLEFKTPTKEVTADPTPEQEAQIAAANETERAAALDVLDRALALPEAEFAGLATEYSIDKKTNNLGDLSGYIGYVYEDDTTYGELIKQIQQKRTRPGVIDGLYETDSGMHIVRFISRQTDAEVTASHILICWAGATRCTGELTQEEALAKIQELKTQATPENFAELAKANSTEPGAATSGGSLGTFRRGVMVEEFETAVFAMEDEAISDVVETPFGYHLIYRQSSEPIDRYELAHIEMPWTTVSDVVDTDPWENTALSGKHVKGASVAFDSTSGAPYILLTFNDEGADLFAQLTEANVGEVIGIFLDGEPVTTPVVQQTIYGGQAQITGRFTVQEAKQVAQRLNAGALPVPITPLSQQTIGPTLGQASLDASITAGLIGFALVALFMVLYYRLPGVVAVVALVLYVSINLAFYKWFGVTITLSGIAGFVLSMGIAVDANVLIFERLKEELRNGRDLPTAVVESVRRAWPSIRDGNATTLIATAILFTMGTSFIKGFALTLTIGILVSIFSAIVVTRSLLLLVVRSRAVRKPFLFLGLK